MKKPVLLNLNHQQVQNHQTDKLHIKKSEFSNEFAFLLPNTSIFSHKSQFVRLKYFF